MILRHTLLPARYAGARLPFDMPYSLAFTPLFLILRAAMPCRYAICHAAYAMPLR